MTKTEFLQSIYSLASASQPKRIGLNDTILTSMSDPVAMLTLVNNFAPNTRRVRLVANRLESLLKEATFDQLVAIYKWPACKYMSEFNRSVVENIIARIEQVGDDADDFPDWLITFAHLGEGEPDFPEGIRMAALNKLTLIREHTSDQLTFIETGDQGPG